MTSSLSGEEEASQAEEARGGEGETREDTLWTDG